MIQKVLKIFKVNSINRLIIIFIVFAITGSLSVILGEYVLLLFFSDDVVKDFFYWLIRILIIFPLYQIILLFVGFIFGEYEYFVEFEKKTFKKLFSIKK